MPELPEAMVVARQLQERLLGAVLEDCWVGRPDIVRQGFDTVGWYRGAKLAGIERRGKSVVLEWAQPGETRYLVAELGMTGLLLFRLPDDRYRKHTHVKLTLAGGRERTLCYWNPRRFGRIYLLDRIGLDRFLGRRFGCDPLTVTREEFLQMVQACRGRLKALLMHQQRIAGIGNIYANEILFRARLHPYRIAARLRTDRVQRLYDAMRSVLSDAIEEGGSSVRDFLAPDGTRGRYRTKHLVYEKTGLPCPAGCGRRIRRLIGERSSFYCPACQPSGR